MYKSCKNDKIKVEFENRKTAFFAIVYRKDIEGLIENAEKNLKANVGVNVGVNDTQTKILNLILENQQITQKEIANALRISSRTVERNVNILKEKGLLERIGADKNGYWQIKI